MSKGPLAGVRIVEVAGIGSGPFCGMMLADLGAEVVTVERSAASLDGRRHVRAAAIVMSDPGF
jgi:crotonobetainyl-CoA:carnitine CoA-transferase CaiB-like acyl-CoA transferase